MIALLALAVAMLRSSADTGAQEYLVIVHASNAITELSASEITKPVSAQAGQLGPRSDRGAGRPPRGFTDSERVLAGCPGKVRGSSQAYLPHRIFSGRGNPPVVEQNDDEVINGVLGKAATGVEAVAMYTEHRPDLVTMDVVMPVVSGLDAVRQIKEIDAAARILVCSAIGQEDLVQEAKDAGALGFVVKPFAPDTLASELDRVAVVDVS